MPSGFLCEPCYCGTVTANNTTLDSFLFGNGCKLLSFVPEVSFLKNLYHFAMNVFVNNALNPMHSAVSHRLWVGYLSAVSLLIIASCIAWVGVHRYNGAIIASPNYESTCFLVASSPAGEVGGSDSQHSTTLTKKYSSAGDLDSRPASDSHDHSSSVDPGTHEIRDNLIIRDVSTPSIDSTTISFASDRINIQTCVEIASVLRDLNSLTDRINRIARLVNDPSEASVTS